MLLYHILGSIPEFTARLSPENQTIDTSSAIRRTEKLHTKKAKENMLVLKM